MNTNSITVLRTTSKDAFATKTIGLRDGQPGIVRGYQLTKTLDAESVSVGSLECLGGVLQDLESDFHAFVVRDRLHPDAQGCHIDRQRARKEGILVDAPCSWLCVDLDDVPIPARWAAFNDHIPELIDHATNRLPSEFHKADCYYQFSSSMGVVPGQLKVHLWFWLARPLTNGEARQWLDGSVADLSLYGAVHPIYTAPPLLQDGVADPVRQRSGLYRQGFGITEVTPPEIGQSPAAPAAPARKPRQRAGGGPTDSPCVRRGWLCGRWPRWPLVHPLP